MDSTRHHISDWYQKGLIPPPRINEALRISRLWPDAGAWRKFLDRMLLWLGGLAIISAVLFFIAYNWSDMGRYFKFGILEILIILSVVGYAWLGTDKPGGKLTLLAASALLGGLLALYGQTYQTGADTWQLFFVWALLSLPWVLIGRFAGLWIFWLALVNITILLYFNLFHRYLWWAFESNTGLLWILFGINTSALAVWEFFGRKWDWLAQRWAVRLLALASGVTLTWLALNAILSHRTGIAAIFIWLAWLACLYLVYRNRVRDLFMLAGASLSAIVVIIAFLSKHILHDNAGTFLLMGLVVIGLGSGAAMWLRTIHREWEK